jgi:Heterokaryon incompatibility protein (HET)
MTSSSAESKGNIYQHAPINRDTKSIRVVELYRAEDFNSDLVCNISEVEFNSDDFPAYEAISYAWGGECADGSHFVMCENDENHRNKLLITRNCALILRHLRKKESTRILWIDSVCIDQFSINDRNHQVQLMGDIYTLADRVIIWLGEDVSQKIGPTFRFLKDLAKFDMKDIDTNLEDKESNDNEDTLGTNSDSENDLQDRKINNKERVEDKGEDKIEKYRREVKAQMQIIWNSKHTFYRMLFRLDR